MTRTEYRRALSDLRSDVAEMGDIVVERLEMGLSALEDNDEDLARTVIEGDEEINRRYLDVESDCIDLFALQQPVAGDLRFVTASFKIITDLERVGDLAVNLGDYALAADRALDPEADVYAIGADARDMVEDAVRAYVEEDVPACYAIADRDDEVDALCVRASERVVRDLIETELDGEEGWEIERLMDDVSRILLTVRDLERIGDHAVNIAARTLYMVENDPELIY